MGLSELDEHEGREWLAGPGWWLPFPTIGPPPSVVRIAWGATRESLVQWLVFVLTMAVFVVGGADWWAYCVAPVMIAQATRDDTAAAPTGWRRYLTIPRKLRLGPRGALNALSAVLLGIVIAWAMHSPGWRLTALALGVAWLCAKASGRLSFTLWTRADDRVLRNLVSSAALFYGPLLVVLMCALSYSGRPWPENVRWLPVALGVSGALVSWHIAQSKFAFFAAEHRARIGKREGQREVLARVHSRITQDLRSATQLASRYQQETPELMQRLLAMQVRLDALEAKAGGRSDDAGFLEEIVWATADHTGADAFADIAVPPLHPDDFDLVQNTLYDLTANAIEAATPVLEVTITARHAVDIVVSDRAGGIPPEKWRTPGSSLERLGSLIEARGGTLTHTVSNGGTQVLARWRLKPIASLSACS